MRCRLLAILALLGATALLHADYVVIVANLNATANSQPPTGNKGNQMGLPAGGGPTGIPGGPTGIPGGGLMMGGAGIMGMAGRQMGMQGGMPSGMGAMGGGSADAIDENPYLIVAVVEIDPPTPRKVRDFLQSRNGLIVKHRWGRSALAHKSANMEAVLIETAASKRMPSIHKTFLARQAELVKIPSTDESIKLARWALQMGLIADFESVMDKLAETEKSNTLVATYLKLKADLAKPVAKADVMAKWKGNLLDGYKVAQSDKHHYAILYNASAGDECKAQLDRLEKSFKGFYYWWAMQRISLPLPSEPLVAVWTDRGDVFRKLQKNLTASPVLADSFVARQEGLSVFSSKRGDAPYITLDTSSKQFWTNGFIRNELIKGNAKGVTGVPRGAGAVQTQEARTRALLLQAMEDEWEATAMSHEASRQLLFATKMLPSNVHVPEWVQFGMGSFFEIPLQSPFGGPGGASPYWLPRFKEYNDSKAKKYGATAYETLIGVITDAHFRASKADASEAKLRQARAAAWALTYFLAQTNLDGLQRYFKELARMPRDIELDAKVLEMAFARAFDCVNPDRTPNQAKLASLAGRWISFTKDQPLEAEAVHRTIRSFYNRMNNPGNNPSGGGMGAGGGLPGN